MTTASCSVAGLKVQLDRAGPDVVDEISFEVFPGEILALVGESGSGKTTVGTALLAHARRGARIVAGTVDIDGTELLGQPVAVSRKRRGSVVAYVPQDPAASLNPVLRVGYQIREVLDVHESGTPAQRDERVREVLAEVALPSDEEFLRRYPHQLSGGQAQRVVIAMAFALRPKVLVLDEPTTGLDVTNQAHVLETVRDLCQRHKVAAVYVTHDLAVVGELAHRVAVLYAGQIVEIGTKEEIFAAPSHPYTRALLAAVPSVTEPRVLTGIAGHAPSPGHRPSGCRFHDRCEYQQSECAEVEPPVIEVSGLLSRCLRAEHVRAQPNAVPMAAPAAECDATDTVLEVAGLSASYGRVEILHDIDISVPRNGCVALVGESGSGKSTLSRCIGGLHDEWTGSILFEGQPVPAGARKRTPQLRKSIQYVFQNPYLALNPRMTVGEIIRRPVILFGLAKGADAEKRVLELLDQVSLPRSAKGLLPVRLSGGERQRVAIARALACEPEVLICDEVTSALDVSVQASIIALLDDLRQTRGLSMLFVTHNLALVRSIATRTVVLEDGRIVEDGPTERVLDTPEADYTKTLLANTPRMATG
ncbi:ABC transporter ATP-binding protein [Actinocrispum sp. NPDC049592]|uniref:ABC transporter ATP-binding protein n=1 Tax=Actinocrispum sp. NPDC049592 TaxID=3154835 RepID=UPI003446A0C0